MKPRQPIKTTAKKIGSVQKKIGKNPNKNRVDVRPYGGYTSLAHKTEAGSHIEQNYSVNVQNQMQLMKKISQVSTLNTSHMHMQLGQLEKELKQWEGKIGKVVKKKDRPLDFLESSTANKLSTPIVHIQKQYKDVFNNNNNKFAISTNPILKINASKSRFSKYGETVIKNANFWVEDIFGTYKDNLVFNQAFIQNINNLEASMSSHLTEKWNEKSSYLVESLVNHLDKVDRAAVTSKTYYKSLKKQDTLSQTALDQLRSYYKSREKNQTVQWMDKEKEFVNQLDSILERILSEEMIQRIEKEYHKLVTGQDKYTRDYDYNHQNHQNHQEHQKELYQGLEKYYKTFEQNKWIKTLIMAQSPLFGGDLYAGVRALYDYLNVLTSDTNTFAKEITVKSLYKLVEGLKTESIDTEIKTNSLNTLLKEQSNLLNMSTESQVMVNAEVDRLLKHLFVVHTKQTLTRDNHVVQHALEEIFMNRDINEIVSLLEENKTIVQEKSEITTSHSEINPINLAVLKSEYTKYHKEYINGTQKTLMWMSQVLAMKDVLVEETLTEIKNDVEKHIHDLTNVQTLHENFQENKSAYITYEQKINRWKQWFKEITHKSSQNGLGVFNIKQTQSLTSLTYKNNLLQDDFVVEGLSKLSGSMETLTQNLKHLTLTVSERQAYEDMAVQDTLKSIREHIDALVTYERTYIPTNSSSYDSSSPRVIEKITTKLLDSIGGKDLIYQDHLYEKIMLQGDELREITQNFGRTYKVKRFDREKILQKQIKATQSKIASKHLELSSKLLINPEDMQVYYMTNGNTMRYAATALSYEEIMNQIETKAYNGFSQMHREIQNQVKNLLASESVKNEMTQSIHYTAHHIHTMIQKLSQQIQQMLGSQTHVLNQRQLMTYSQLLFGENGVEAVTQKLVHFVERQYLKTMGLGTSSVTAYMNSSNEQIKRNLIRNSNNTWIKNQSISPWILQVLQGGINNQWSIPLLRASHYNTRMNSSYNRIHPMAYSFMYPMTHYSTGHYREDHQGFLHQFLPAYHQHHRWSDQIAKGAKVFREYAYERFDKLYSHLQKSDTFLQSEVIDTNLNTMMRDLIEKQAPIILDKENQNSSHKESTYGSSPTFYDSYQNSQQFYRKEASSRSVDESNNHQTHTSIYNDTLIAYASEAVEASSDELSKELLSQKALIEIIQSELAVLRDEKQVEQINIDKLSDTLLKELSHKVRKDRQRKGWI